MILQRLKKIFLIFIIGQLIATLYLFKLRGFDLSPIVQWDSNFYIDASERFPNLLPEQKLYLGMAAYLKVSSLLGSVKWIAVIGNSLSVITAAECLWQITKKYSSDSRAWLAVCIWLLNPLTAQWTRWVMSEPLYYSAVIIWIWLALFKTSFLLITFSTLASTLRPNAIILLGSAITWTSTIKKQFTIKEVIKITTKLVIIMLFLIAFIFIRFDTSKLILIESFSNGQVIHNMPEVSIEMRSTPFSYISLFFHRIGWELIQLRPWYSFKNNFFISIFMILFYILAIRGGWIIRQSKLFIAISLITIPSLIIIGCTWSIYEGRFGWWFLVSWIPLVAIGTQSKETLIEINSK